MNLASWIILGIVVAIIGLAVKATFFGKKKRGGCCDCGDPVAHGCAPSACTGCAEHASCNHVQNR